MKNKRNPVGWFEIYVGDLERATRFYEGTFGVKLQALPTSSVRMMAFPQGPELAGCAGALVKTDGKPAGGGGTLVYFSCADCAVESARAVKHGGTIIAAKSPIGEYGYIAHVGDTEGNVIGLHSLG